MNHAIALTVNGEQVSSEVESRVLLSDYLRDHLGATDVHTGCEHGVCGACTVLVDDQPVRSCLMFACQADGVSVRTVESLATDGGLHPLQTAFKEHHALQCGFCTPGFLITITYMLDEGFDLADEPAVRTALSGNLCRCTGYQNIVDAVLEISAVPTGKESK